MKERQLNRFDKGLDLGTSKHLLGPDYFIDSGNIRIGDQDDLENMLGNVEVVNSLLAAGVNTCIGSLEDKRGNSIIYFIHNSNSDHGIWRYYPLESNRIELLMQSSELGFSLDRKIHSARVVDGRLLYWTDGLVSNGSISGNFPMKINMDTASVYQKKLAYSLFFGDSSFNVGAEYRIEFLNIDGTVQIADQNLYTVQVGDTHGDVISAIIAALDLLGVDGLVLDNSTANKIDVTHRSFNSRIVITAVGHSILFTAENHYPLNISSFHLAIAKPVPRNAPNPFFSIDAFITNNRCYGFAFRFRYRYLFKDGERSKWSPISYVPTNFKLLTGAVVGAQVENSQEYNKVINSFSDSLIADSIWRGLMKGIEIAVQYGYDGLWRTTGVVDFEDYGIETTQIDFDNHGTYPVIGSDESSSVDTQALGNMDFVPLVCSAMETVVDKDGSYMLLLFGNLFGYDIPKVKADISVLSQTLPVTNYPSNQASYNKTLKSGGTYDVGVIYEDGVLQRQSPVIHLGSARVPFSQFGPGTQKYLSVTFNSAPPFEAERYRLVISENQNQAVYFQAGCKRIVYWKIDSSIPDDTVVTTHAAGDATHMGFELRIEDLNDPDVRNILFDRASGEVVFLPESKDRIQIVNANFGGFPSGDMEEFNFPVAGYSLTYPTTGVSVDRLTVFVEFSDVYPDLSFGASPTDLITVEIYRPSDGGGNGLYYEFGSAFDIIDPRDSKRRHQSSNVILYGDCFITSRRFVHNFNGGGPYDLLLQNIQRPWLHPLPDVRDVGSDFGRAHALDPDYKQVFDYGQIRASGVYSPTTEVNNLSSFKGIDYIRVNRDFGPGMSLQLVDRVLLAICENKSQPIYVGKDAVVDLSGNSLVGISSALLTIADELMYDLGTIYPASITKEEERVYCWDGYKGKIWRYTTGGGQVPISDVSVDDFLSQYSIINQGRSIPVVSGYDRRYRTLFMTFDDSFTMWFKERSLGEQGVGVWGKEVSFIGESYRAVSSKMVSFKEGALWLHDSGSTYCNFYGVQYDAWVTFVVNSSPEAVKDLLHIWQESTGLWFSDYVVSLPTDSYPTGMRSQLIQNKWALYEGQYRADFLRDQTDPSIRFSSIVDANERLVTALLSGRAMKGEVFEIRLKLVNPTILQKLRSVSTFYSKSFSYG